MRHLTPLAGRPCLVGLLAGICLCFTAQAQGPAPTWDWARAINGSSTAWPADLAVDAAGNSYVVGVFYGTMTLGSTSLSTTGQYDPDGFLVKYTPAGTVAWAQRLGTSGSYESTNGVALDAAGNVYITGRFTNQLTLGGTTLTSSAGDAYLIKYDPQGAVQWARQTTSLGPGGSAQAYDVALDAAGHVYVTGFFSWGGTRIGRFALAPASGDTYAHYLAQYDAAGTEQWALAEGSTLSTGPRSSYLMPAPGGGMYAAYSLELSPRFGSTAYPSRGAYDAYLVQYDELGNRHRVQQLGGPGNDEIRQGTVDDNGNLYLPFTYGDQARVGSRTFPASGFNDQALLKLDSQGTLVWAQTVNGPDSDFAQSAVLDPFGNAYLMGWFVGTATTSAGQSFTSAGHYDALMLSFTAQGLPRWGVAAGGFNPDDFVAMGFDAAGQGRVCGRFSERMPLGPTTLTAPYGTSNWFLAAFTDSQPTVATIAGLTPASGTPGQVVTLTGTGFVGVTEVLFNGTPAAAFTVQSATRLQATVPAGATTGPVRVRTSAGTGQSATPFQLTTLAAHAPASTSLALYPNPAHDQLHLPALPAGTAVQLLDALGRVVRQVPVAAGRVSVLGLPAGLYQLRATDQQGRRFAGRVLVQ